jgi:hypothetical protein
MVAEFIRLRLFFSIYKEIFMKKILEPIADLPHVTVYKPTLFAEMQGLVGNATWDLVKKEWFEKAAHHGAIFICISKIDKKRRWAFQPATDTWINEDDSPIELVSASTLADALEAIAYVLTASHHQHKEAEKC